MAQSDEWWGPGASWAGTVSVETCYAFDPAHDWPVTVQGKLMGVQSCLWNEILADRRLFDHLVCTRLSAIAETAWPRRDDKGFGRFMAIQTLMPGDGVGAVERPAGSSGFSKGCAPLIRPLRGHLLPQGEKG